MPLTLWLRVFHTHIHPIRDQYQRKKTKTILGSPLLLHPSNDHSKSLSYPHNVCACRLFRVINEYHLLEAIATRLSVNGFPMRGVRTKTKTLTYNAKWRHFIHRMSKTENGAWEVHQFWIDRNVMLSVTQYINKSALRCELLIYEEILLPNKIEMCAVAFYTPNDEMVGVLIPLFGTLLRRRWCRNATNTKWFAFGGFSISP